jgi:hypothetical protein
MGVKDFFLEIIVDSGSLNMKPDPVQWWEFIIITRRAIRATATIILTLLPFVKVRIMNPMVNNLPRTPIKRGMTLRTPHLTTSINLENRSCTLGT